MAGYIMNLNSIKALKNYILNGVYSTVIPKPRQSKKKGYYWQKYHEGTFADYATMKPGDNIYFFIDRKIYGIGKLVKIKNNCKFLNFSEANKPYPYEYNKIKDKLLWDEGERSKNQRWLCTFKPSPYFFKQGVDMDDVLASNPSKFKSLRAFWKLSFIKIDDEENQALKDVILKFNEKNLKHKNNIFPSSYSNFHSKINKIINGNYKFNIDNILLSCAEGKKIRHEMALEAGLLFQLSNQCQNTIDIFGEYDYLSHQVIASPFKPIDYMDKIDIFGYSYITGFKPTKSKYLVIELKRDPANKEDVEQLLKYVDWVKGEYAYGDYSMINAYLVAFDFSRKVIEHTEQVAKRKYTIGRRPPQSREWANLNLVTYSFNKSNNKLEFTMKNN